MEAHNAEILFDHQPEQYLLVSHAAEIVIAVGVPLRLGKRLLRWFSLSPDSTETRIREKGS